MAFLLFLLLFYPVAYPVASGFSATSEPVAASLAEGIEEYTGVLDTTPVSQVNNAVYLPEVLHVSRESSMTSVPVSS